MAKVLTWRLQILNITMIRHPQVKLYHLKPQGMLYVDIILSYATESSIPQVERVKKVKLEELSKNISDRSEAKGTGILSDSLLAGWRCEFKANELDS